MGVIGRGTRDPDRAGGALALRDLRVWDGVSEGYAAEPLTLRIEAGRIAAIGSDRRLCDGAHVIELAGRTALPGLCDAHVHLTLDPGSPPAEQRDGDSPGALERAHERTLAMLRAGITTARDLGGGRFVELELRDRIARGQLTGPRLLCAGQPVTSPGGHVHYWGGVAANLDEIRSVVRRQVERGADWIKVMATGGVLTRGTRIREAQFSAADLEALVAEARAHERPVAAHCHGTEGIRRAVQAGARTIEHCSFAGAEGFGSDLDERLPERMAELGTFVSPTVNSGWRRFLDVPGERGRLGERMRTCFRSLRAAGVRMIASTDAGIPGVAHDRLPDALAVFARAAELRPVEALRAATSEAARALGLAEETGALRPGLAADVLVVDGDPLADLAALLRPRLVVARGAVIELGL